MLDSDKGISRSELFNSGRKSYGVWDCARISMQVGYSYSLSLELILIYKIIRN